MSDDIFTSGTDCNSNIYSTPGFRGPRARVYILREFDGGPWGARGGGGGTHLPHAASDSYVIPQQDDIAAENLHIIYLLCCCVYIYLQHAPRTLLQSTYVLYTFNNILG